MGLTLSVCVSDSSLNASEYENVEREDNENPVLVKTKYEILSIEKPRLEIQTEELSNSIHSVESNQSVLTVISPTKDISKRSSLQSPFPAILPILGEKEPVMVITGHIYGSIARGDVNELEQLIKEHNIDITNVKLQSLLYTPLHVAVLHNQLQMVKYLLSKGVDVDTKDLDGQSAVYLAYTLGFGAITDVVVAHKAASFCNSPYSPYASSSMRDGSFQSDTRSIRSRGYSVSTAGDEICPDIIVPRFSSFRSIHSINSIQQNSIKRSAVEASEDLVPSPFTSDSATTATAYNQKPSKPFSKRLRKAASKAINLVLPSKITNKNV